MTPGANYSQEEKESARNLQAPLPGLQAAARRRSRDSLRPGSDRARYDPRGVAVGLPGESRTATRHRPSGVRIRATQRRLLGREADTGAAQLGEEGGPAPGRPPGVWRGSGRWGRALWVSLGKVEEPGPPRGGSRWDSSVLPPPNPPPRKGEAAAAGVIWSLRGQVGRTDAWILAECLPGACCGWLGYVGLTEELVFFHFSACIPERVKSQPQLL